MVLQGRRYVSESLAELLLLDMDRADKPLHTLLSDREFQIFGKLAAGTRRFGHRPRVVPLREDRQHLPDAHPGKDAHEEQCGPDQLCTYETKSSSSDSDERGVTGAALRPASPAGRGFAGHLRPDHRDHQRRAGCHGRRERRIRARRDRGGRSPRRGRRDPRPAVAQGHGLRSAAGHARACRRSRSSWCSRTSPSGTYRETALALGARDFLDKSRDYDRLPAILTEIAVLAARLTLRPRIRARPPREGSRTSPSRHRPRPPSGSRWPMEPVTRTVVPRFGADEMSSRPPSTWMR